VIRLAVLKTVGIEVNPILFAEPQFLFLHGTVKSPIFYWKFNRLKKYSLFFQFLLKRICVSVLSLA